jgi:hypothetical protein
MSDISCAIVDFAQCLGLSAGAELFAVHVHLKHKRPIYQSSAIANVARVRARMRCDFLPRIKTRKCQASDLFTILFWYRGGIFVLQKSERG